MLCSAFPQGLQGTNVISRIVITFDHPLVEEGKDIDDLVGHRFMLTSVVVETNDGRYHCCMENERTELYRVGRVYHVTKFIRIYHHRTCKTI